MTSSGYVTETAVIPASEPHAKLLTILFEASGPNRATFKPLNQIIGYKNSYFLLLWWGHHSRLRCFTLIGFIAGELHGSIWEDSEHLSAVSFVQ